MEARKETLILRQCCGCEKKFKGIPFMFHCEPCRTKPKYASYYTRKNLTVRGWNKDGINI